MIVGVVVLVCVFCLCACLCVLFCFRLRKKQNNTHERECNVIYTKENKLAMSSFLCGLLTMCVCLCS